MRRPTSSNSTLRDGVAFVAAFAAYLGLGAAVARAPVPAIDRAFAPLAGHGAPLAIAFTVSCWWEALVALGVVALTIGVLRPAWRARAVFSTVLTVASWRISDAFKDVFRRPRPEYWVWLREPSFSYASGHAMFAVVVYGLWASYAAHSDLPPAVRRTVATALSLWAIGVVWSRLALGAHYVSDLAGGVLLGVALLSLGRLIVAAVARRPLAV